MDLRPEFRAPQMSSKSRSPTYELPTTPTAVGVARAAADLEAGCAETYAYVVANTAGADRRWAVEALGLSDPTRCVYVGDRLFDDIWGARNAGLRSIHIPLSNIPHQQVGHTEGEPDAVVHSLSEIATVVAEW